MNCASKLREESLQQLGAADGEADQALFLGRLRQLGLLYRFAVRLGLVATN